MTGIPSQFYLIGNALSAAEQNHTVLSQNIANINTPGYKSQTLDFGALMDKIEKRETNQGFVEKLPVKLTKGLSVRNDGNNIDVDLELAQLKKNALAYRTYSQLLASKMSTLRKSMS